MLRMDFFLWLPLLVLLPLVFPEPLQLHLQLYPRLQLIFDSTH